MLNTENQYRLVFSTNTDVPLPLLTDALRQQQFIGAALFVDNKGQAAKDDEYCVGDAFLRAITFMGCSPCIEFEPPAGLEKNDTAAFCFIRLSACQQKNQMYHAGQFEALKTLPRCRQCRNVISNWADCVSGLNSHWQLQCPHCQADLAAESLDWRKASGSGNVFIEVLNVYLQEAVPTDAFIQQLENISQSKWGYFYTDTDLKIKLLDRS